ncbi:MAG: T9SS type A sorting domain-containing protein [Bacteroidales bacterium]|nr:T9SS type A sorting domain-containing protein [Bacteroidales bacterium]
MKRLILFLASFALVTASQAQLKPRSDAFPWVPEPEPKVVNMASSVEQMANWNRYPTYSTYLAMMQQWAENYPNLCSVDTIGTSTKGRLVLAMHIVPHDDADIVRPQFFYSSTIHGDEVTGFVMMLRLIDTLLKGYGTNPDYTQLMNHVDITINPLANPDGTYRGGDNTLSGAMRYNGNYVDLNRNFPDPFGTPPIDAQQKEVTDMIAYFSSRHFVLSANLHGGAEVMNYPWDSFTSSQNLHPYHEWWRDVCKRFIDTTRSFSNSHFRDVTSEGYIVGGDWYVIPNGRQDYVNYVHNCLEMTMEISVDKKLSSDELPEYWRFLQHSLVNYIREILTLPNTVDIVQPSDSMAFSCYPNPTSSWVRLSAPAPYEVMLFSANGALVQRLPAGTEYVDMQSLHKGVYLLRCGGHTAKIVKQ